MADASLGADLITAVGAGSDKFNVNGLVEGLMAAESAPVNARLDRQEENLDARLSAFGSVKGALAGFQGLLSGLTTLSDLQQRTVTSSDSSLFTATSSGQATPGSYRVEVNQLAQSHSLYSGSFSSTTDSVGSGTLTFRFGTTVYDSGSDKYSSFSQNSEKAAATITIDSGNNSLQGVRDTVNSADIGVQATIVNDGSGYRLLFTSTESGENNSLEVVADDGDGDDTDSSGLSQLAFNGSATNLSQSVVAQDSETVVNGLTVTRGSNTLSGVVEGVMLELQSASPGSAHTLTVAHDTASLKGGISNFVGDYNALMTVFDSYTRYDASSEEAGALQGDSALRSMISDIRGVLADTLDGLEGSMTTLRDIGISSDRYGKLELDEAVLDSAISDDFDRVARIFAVGGDADDALVRYDTFDSDTSVAGEYALNITQLATQGLLSGEGNLPSGFSPKLTIDAENDNFVVKVDGVSSGTLTLTHGEYKNAGAGDALAADVQSMINGDSALQAAGVSAVVTYDEGNNRLIVNSSSYGAGSSVEITSVDTNTAAELGFSVGAGVAGQDVAGTIGGEAATGSGRFLTGSAGDVEGIRLEVLGGSIGARNNVNFSRGYADQLNTVLSRILDDEGVLEGRLEGLSDRLGEIGEKREKLQVKLDRMELRWRQQFTALNALMGEMESTGTFLEQTFKAMRGET